MKQGWVYILASRRNGTLYVGVTSELLQRISQHRDGLVPGFTSAHAVIHLVWYELHGSMEAAIHREKAIKRWHRAWKLALIERDNPEWRDLWPTLSGGEAGPPLPRVLDGGMVEEGS